MKHQPTTIPLSEAGAMPLAVVGGKAQALGRLITYGAPVPPGFVIPPLIDLTTDTQAEILAALESLGASMVAVRSSAAGEDAIDQSWAGQFDSFLYVDRANLLARIADCRTSNHSSRAQAYGSTEATSSVMLVAVIIQTMVSADAAGVLFTANPVTKDRTQIVIEAVFGLGELLVQGLATPDNYLLDRTGHLLHQAIVRKPTMLIGSPAGTIEQSVPFDRQTQSALTPTEMAKLVALAIKLEAHFGYPLDIEWAYAHNEPYIVQARPITTL